MKLKFAFVVFAAVAFAGCKPKLEPGTPEKGNVDATRYVAVGGSVTAGFADGALYYEGQENSFVNILAGQFKLIGGGEFRQPWMAGNSVGVGFTGQSRSILGYKQDCLGTVSLSPLPFSTSGGDMNAFTMNVYSESGPYNNMGVPGAKITDLNVAGYGNQSMGTYNPFFFRMSANPSTSSVLGDAANLNPTFYSLYIGEQDILNYALSGGTSNPITPVNGAAGTGFDGSLNNAVTTLSANGARGVVGNIPDITLYPFFNTVPYDGLVLDAANAETLNNVYNQLGIYFHEGNNAFIIADADAPLGVRQIQKGELILLTVPLDSMKCQKLGSLFPIPNQHILDAEEVATINAGINAYNAVIANTASTYGLALADVNAYMKTVKTGVVFNGIAVNANFVSGGAFSLDGIHLNPIGQALLANVFIKSINRSFGSSIPQVDATKYRGVKFP